MHPYSINTNERVVILYIIAGISIGLMYIISLIPFRIPFYLEWFSPFLIYTILYHSFDKKLWKLNLINKLIKTTNLNGKYSGILKSNRDNFSKEHFVDLEIIQNWTTICIHLTTNLSNSFSVTSAISVMEGIGINLLYYFHSSPKATAPSDMHSHYGFAEILFKKNLFKNAESNYFTGRDREYYGSVVYKKL